MLYTFEDGRDFVADFVEAGSCPDLAVVESRLNEAQRRLLEKAPWDKTVRTMSICTSNNCFACPREVEIILDVNIDSKPKLVFGRTYEFHEYGPGRIDCDACVCCKDLEDLGNHWPTFFPMPPNQDLKLMALSTHEDDLGAEIRIMGRNSLKEEIIVDDVFGEVLPVSRWENGTEGLLNTATFPSLTTKYFREVSRVYKDVTKGYVTLFAYDEDTKKMWLLAKYHPDETIPNYRRYKIIGHPIKPDASGEYDDTYYTSVLCLVKLRHVPLKYDNDILLIQNLDALKMMVMAIREENSGNIEMSLAYEAKAIKELESQLRNSTTHDNLAFRVTGGGFAIGTTPNIQ